MSQGTVRCPACGARVSPPTNGSRTTLCCPLCFTRFPLVQEPSPAPPLEAPVSETKEFSRALREATPKAYVTPLLLGANILLFALMAVDGVSCWAPKTEDLINWGANFGLKTLGGDYWRVITNCFLHLGAEHLALNMVALGVAGLLAERLFGNGFYFWIYLFSGTAGSVARLFWNPDLVSAGASGAVFGLYGALLAYLIRQKQWLPKAVLLKLVFSVIAILGCSVACGLALPGIDNVAHLGGFAGGFVAGFAVALPLGKDARKSRAWRGTAAATLVTLLFAGATALLVIGPARTFHAAMARCAAQERLAEERLAQLFGQAKAGTISDADLAASLETECYQRWQAIVAELEAAPVPRSETIRKLRALFVPLARYRRDALAVTIEGLQNQDETRIDEARALNEKARALGEELKRLGGIR